MTQPKSERTVPSIGHRLRWLILSFIPSSLLLSVTAYLTTDLTPFPLLWVIPLGLYLLTFVLVFARRPFLPHSLMIRALPFLVAPISVMIVHGVTRPMGLLFSLYLVMFFVASMVCHGELARSRPSSRHLTEFYLWLSTGGVLGGIFVALAAPVIFNRVVEYPLAITLACLVSPGIRPPSPRGKISAPLAGRQHLTTLLCRVVRCCLPASLSRCRLLASLSLDFLFPLGIGVLALGLSFCARALHLNKEDSLAIYFVYFVPLLVCTLFYYKPIRFGLGIGAFMLVSLFFPPEWDRLLASERNFFGVKRVMLNREGQYHEFFHGTTLHGRQCLDPARRQEPLTYFTRSGPIGQMFEALPHLTHQSRIAVVGLGVGTLACYSKPGQQWDFYEIDPEVKRIATDRRYFTFLNEMEADVHIILGDARLSLMKAQDHSYDLIVLDAFSSDSIPVHLITEEAVRLYLTKLREGGVLVFNISNNFLELESLMGNLSGAAGIVGLSQFDRKVSREEEKKGKTASHWVLMARDPKDFGPLVNDPRWHSLPRDGRAVWTDDFSNVVSVIRWK